MKTVAAIHTAMPMVEPTKELFATHLPGVRLINIVDDSLIQDVIREGGVPSAVEKRMLAYYSAGIDAGADLIFNTCSSVGDVALAARDKLPVPLVKIDDAMAREAVKSFSRIAVMATLETTLAPTVRLLQRFAAEMDKEIELVDGLAAGAFEAVISGDREKHDVLILETAAIIAGKADALVLAQGSMARMAQQLKEATGKKVFSSPESGVLDVKRVLDSI